MFDILSLLIAKSESIKTTYFAGKYAMRDLVQKLPSGNPQHDHGTSDDTIAAVLATLNEVIKKHPEFSRLELKPCTDGPRYMREIGTEKYVLHITNSHIKKT